MLNRSLQLGLKVEGSEGVRETLVAAEFQGNRKEISGGFSVAEYDRALVKQYLSNDPALKGSRLGNINWMEELVGGAIATAAPFHTTLKMMGFLATQVKKMTIGTITNGPYKAGQVIGNNATFASATKTGVVYKVSGTTLWYVPTTGTFAATDVIYNYASPQTSATMSGTLTNGGYSFTPISETSTQTPSSVSAEYRRGGQVFPVVGARGKGALMLKRDEPILISAELQGVPVFDVTDPANPTPIVEDGGSVPYITGVAAVGGPPSMLKSIPLKLRLSTGDYTPIATELTINIENGLASRPTVADNDLYGSGYLSTRITTRKVTGSIDPEHIKAADGFDFIKYLTGGGTFQVLTEVGATTGTNGLVQIFAPEVGLKGDWNTGDRDGITTAPLSLEFYDSTGLDRELVINHLF